MSKRMPIHHEPPPTVSVATGSFASRIRESLVRKIQANDGCSRREAEMQIDVLAAELREPREPRRTLHLPSFYLTRINTIAKTP
jgi:hypothetical protein